MRIRSFFTAILILAGLAGEIQSARAEPVTIEKLTVQGLSRMDPQAFSWMLEIKEGDPYDEELLRRRFKELWRKKLFEDIVIESDDGPAGGKIVVIKLRERPVLSAVTYEENKVLTRTQIEDHLKERDLELRLGQALDLGQVYFAESAIRELFAQKGFLDAAVESVIAEVTTTSRSVEFLMNPGGKTRIRGIDFTGNTVYKDRKLKKLLKLTEERRWYWPWSSKNLYHPVKWDQDVTNVREAYQNKGYIDIDTRAPIVDVRRKKKKKGDASETDEADHELGTRGVATPPPLPPIDPTLPEKQRAKAQKKREQAERKARKQIREQSKKESKRWIYLTVPVTEGPQYTLGEVTFVGSEIFTEPLLRSMIPVAGGAVLNNGAVRVGTERITRMYEDRGYLYANVVQRAQRRAEGNVADVLVTIEEDRPYHIGRIDFRGNTATHDRVIRREMTLSEGDLFSRTKLEVSQARVNQLGYFGVQREPVIEPLENEGTVRIVLPGIEQGRNEIQVGGGYSGLEGAFFSGIYSTRNFLGRGQVLSTALQIGGNANRYQISFQEPWFLGKPYLFGVSLFRRDTDFGSDLSSTSTGGGVQVGRRVGNFSRINLSYNFEDVTSRSVTSGNASGDGQVLETKNTISSLTPVYTFSTVNSPYRPTRGTQLTVSTQIAGGPLGGNVSYVRPRVLATRYQRAFGRSFLAVHGQLGIVFPYDEENEFVTASSNVKGIPRYQRFWLGGDTLGPRIFETRTITPRRYVRVVDGQIVEVTGDITGKPPEDFIQSNGVPVPIEVGGDRMYLLQTEWVLPLNEQADMAVFFDMGDALFEDTDLDFTTLRASAGLELRFNLPIFPVPLRLIYGFPVRELDFDRSSNFTFSIGRSF